jgi:hypothetical protein
MEVSMRFLSGKWWKKVSFDEIPEEGGVSLKGDPNALSKWWFILWRFQHQWVLFEVDTEDSYWVFFADRDICMKYRKKIVSKRFLARLGKSHIRFMVTKRLDDVESLPIKEVERG